MRVVRSQDDSVFGLGSIKRRPTTTGIEFRFRFEELLAARGALVRAWFELVIVQIGVRSFGPLFTQHVILLGREPLFPFFFGQDYLVGHARTPSRPRNL